MRTVNAPDIGLYGLPSDHRQTGKDRAVARLLLKEDQLSSAERFEWYHLTSQNEESDYAGTPFDE